MWFEWSLTETLELGSQKAGGWLVTASFGCALNPEICPEVFSVESSHGLTVDVEGGSRIDDYLLAVMEEIDHV